MPWGDKMIFNYTVFLKIIIDQMDFRNGKVDVKID
jgi:hypothetical protein